MENQKRSILILGAGIMQIPAIKTAKKMGLNAIAVDKNERAPGFKYADLALNIDTMDIDSLSDFVFKYKDKYNIAGVFAAADNAISAASLNEKFGFLGVSKFSAYNSKNKWRCKKLWLKHKVPTPFAVEVKNLEDAKKAIEKIGLPCMIKAIDSSASRGTQKIETYIELEEALNEAFKYSSTNTALVEEFVDGEEYSVETVMYNDTQFRFGIAKREYEMLPLPIETGHINPATLDPTLEEEMYKVVKKAASILKIKNAPAKADMIVRKQDAKVMILEMAARLSGGFHSQYTTPISTGMNPIKFVMQITIGDRPTPDTYTKHFKRVSICRCIFPTPGIIERIDGLEKAKKIKGVHHIFLMVKEGDKIEQYKNCAHRVCYVIVSGNTYNEANSIFEKVKNTISIKTRSIDGVKDKISI